MLAIEIKFVSSTCSPLAVIVSILQIIFCHLEIIVASLQIVVHDWKYSEGERKTEKCFKSTCIPDNCVWLDTPQPSCNQINANNPLCRQITSPFSIQPLCIPSPPLFNFLASLFHPLTFIFKLSPYCLKHHSIL